MGRETSWVDSVRVETVDALILKSQPYGESHRLVTIITSSRGGLRAIANGAQKQHAALYSVTHAMMRSRLQIRIPADGLAIVVQGEALDLFPEIRVDPVLLAYAASIEEYVLRLAETGNALPWGHVFDAVIDSLHELGVLPPRLAFVRLELKLFPYVGLKLESGACAGCQAPLMSCKLFSLVLGGGLCVNCGKRGLDPYAMIIQPETWGLLQVISHNPIIREFVDHAPKDVQQELVHILRVYTAEYAGISLRSLAIAEKLDLL